MALVRRFAMFAGVGEAAMTFDRPRDHEEAARQVRAVPYGALLVAYVACFLY